MKPITATSILALTCGMGALGLTAGAASAQTTQATQAARDDTTSVTEIVVTAQKREQNIQAVGMSIQAATGVDLTNKGVNNTSDLIKIVPGFIVTGGASGAPQFGLRGVIYLDTSLAANPTVSIYSDQFPLPFSIESTGATLDLQRVEVLKGPQGTLFGDNATGGAINYIANTPTNHLEAGADVQYGRFNTLDAQGYVSGPLSSTLNARIALRTVQGDGWQKNYLIPGETLGAQNLTTGRLSFDWKPNSRLHVVATLSGFSDKSQSTAPQLVGFSPLSPPDVPTPRILSSPLSPQNDQAAAWPTCINDAPFNNHCVGYDRKNIFYMGALRADYDLGNDITLTSLTSYERFSQYQPASTDGTIFQDSQAIGSGHLNTAFQELRLSGNFWGKGVWIVGGNYQNDAIGQKAFVTIPDSSAAAIIPAIGIQATSAIEGNTAAGFVHAEYPVFENLTLEGGLRFTQANQSFVGCERDLGNGLVAAFNNAVFGTHILPGGCVTLHEDLTAIPPVTAVEVHSNLDENNISYRFGANWKVADAVRLYANVSQGYKAGAFSNISALSDFEYTPAVQEKLVAYEGGIKSELFDHTLQFNAAGFYYDYTNKQILGSEADPLFGALGKLINIPQSHVAGFEVSAVWEPIPGLTLAPVVSYADSRIDGHFITINYLAHLQDMSGQHFPGVPELQADFDAEYDWTVSNGWRAFVGGNVNYQGDQNSSLGANPLTAVPAYTLLDLRAGMEHDNLRVELWGRNVTNAYYYTAQVHSLDTYVRYAGMPVTYGVTLSYRYR